MDMKPVDSSTIHSVGHDPATKVLHVKFHHGGTYTYHGVTADDHKAMVKAASVGKHFHANIRGKYKTVKQ